MSHCTDVPIVFVTAVYKEEAFVRKGYQAGGVDYFGKPFDPDILRMKLAIYSSFRMKADMLKAKEQQLRETEELLQAGRKLASVLEGLPVGVIIADMSGRICQTNGNVARICKALDPSGDQSYGKILGWWDEEGQIIKEKGGPLARALESGQTSHNEILKISCDEDSEKTLLCSASPLHGFDGHPVGAVVVLQDVTESKKIEEDLEQRIARFISLGVELQHSSTH
jgi:PAS domain-containing protein